ncbi:MAG: LacI family DNA-binding transcriptional regulator [Proteobacteria bacterium]|nr:LacI family DNA-binding transcriptional regulator [Pseudomonadota bacterium]
MPSPDDDAKLKMEDIAREAGVSIATVSRVFNRPGVVHPDTLARVKEIASRLRYTPNLTAGSLAGNRSRIIAAVIPTITNSIFSETIDGLSTVLTGRGYQLLLGQTSYRDDQQAALIETFLGRRVDGLVLTGITRDRKVRTRLKSARIPIVETWEFGANPIDMLVGFSNEKAGAAAADYLIGRGYARLGFIGGSDQRSGARLEGFCHAVAAAGIAPCRIVRIPSPSPSSVMAGSQAIAQLLHERPKPDAVFCSNDMIALGALVECQRRGLNVPRQLAVMGFSDLPIAKAVAPSLTTVQVGAMDIGSQAATMLLEKIEKGHIACKRVDLGFSIVARESA